MVDYPAVSEWALHAKCSCNSKTDGDLKQKCRWQSDHQEELEGRQPETGSLEGTRTDSPLESSVGMWPYE